ncbi:MAG TPA: hypothetical protein PLZ78_10000, partial [Spirochaetota bacterium]|nr:hypothetical protein [Spirochaetota bacterium]
RGFMLMPMAELSTFNFELSTAHKTQPGMERHSAHGAPCEFYFPALKKKGQILFDKSRPFTDCVSV